MTNSMQHRGRISRMRPRAANAALASVIVLLLAVLAAQSEQ
jgi:hypothetical protein